MTALKDLDSKTILESLKAQWQPYHAGKCFMLSKGEECHCHLCLLDELYSRQLASAADVRALVEAAKEVVRISDRKHDAWDKLKAVLARIGRENEI